MTLRQRKEAWGAQLGSEKRSGFQGQLSSKVIRPGSESETGVSHWKTRSRVVESPRRWYGKKKSEGPHTTKEKSRVPSDTLTLWKLKKRKKNQVTQI